MVCLMSQFLSILHLKRSKKKLFSIFLLKQNLFLSSMHAVKVQQKSQSLLLFFLYKKVYTFYETLKLRFSFLEQQQKRKNNKIKKKTEEIVWTRNKTLNLWEIILVVVYFFYIFIRVTSRSMNDILFNDFYRASSEFLVILFFLKDVPFCLRTIKNNRKVI